VERLRGKIRPVLVEYCGSQEDVIIEKAFAKKLPWAGWTYSFAKKRKVYGLHVVVLLWCSLDGRFS